MDPEENLKRQRELAEAIIRDATGYTFRAVDAGRELAELVQALDGWLCHGGFPPQAWATESVS